MKYGICVSAIYVGAYYCKTHWIIKASNCFYSDPLFCHLLLPLFPGLLLNWQAKLTQVKLMLWYGPAVWAGRKKNHSSFKHSLKHLVTSFNREGNTETWGWGRKQTHFKRLNMLTLGEDLNSRMPLPSPLVESLTRRSHGYLNVEVCKWGQSGSWRRGNTLIQPLVGVSGDGWLYLP